MIAGSATLRTRMIAVLTALISMVFVISTFDATVAHAAASNSAVIDFGDVECTLTVHHIHYSQGFDDISVHSTTACVANTNPRRVFTADRIEMETKLSYGPVPGFMENFHHCPPKGEDSKYSVEVPCHGPSQGPGWYGAGVTATVTVRGETKSVKATDGPRQIEPKPLPA